MTCVDGCLALVALFVVGLTDFLTYPPFAIELTEYFYSEILRDIALRFLKVCRQKIFPARKCLAERSTLN